jgi:Dolichyl-phosphate-mannose-protein mannosyltransferase
LAGTLSLEIPRASSLISSRRLAQVALGVAVLAALIVRVWALGAVGFNSDEAVYSGQAASLAGDPTYTPLFSVFRAHPLLVQFIVSLVFHVTRADVAVRMVSVIFGLAAIPLAYQLGQQLYSRRVGLIAAAIMAVMPYHVAVSRQILLDGPMMTLWLLTMLLLARYAATGRPGWLYATALAGGLTFLAKETSVLVVVSAIAFTLVTPQVKLGIRRLLIAAFLYLVALSPYPLAVVIGGGSSSARSFLLWQLLRQPNHSWSFYFEILPGAVGILVLIAAAGGILLALRRRSWEDRLLLAWVVVPFAFFQIWPTKGYQYLLPIAPALAILAGRAFEGRWLDWASARWSALARRRDEHPRLVRRAAPLALALMLVSIAVPSVQAVTTTSALGSLAGTGGLAGGREAGTWIRQNVPVGSTFMTIGPTLSNLIEYYGQRRSMGLSVSPNPLRRNPAYDPINNPDKAIRELQIQYIAWDIWSASRSPFFSSHLQRYIDKYHGKQVYAQTAPVRSSDGQLHDAIVIRIYEVHP